jgi:hypothetical protein
MLYVYRGLLFIAVVVVVFSACVGLVKVMGWLPLLPHWLKPTNEPRTVPNLDAMPINEAFRLLDCRRIVGANNRFESIEMSVAPDEVSPIVFHPKAP